MLAERGVGRRGLPYYVIIVMKIVYFHVMNTAVISQSYRKCQRPHPTKYSFKEQKLTIMYVLLPQVVCSVLGIEPCLLPRKSRHRSDINQLIGIVKWPVI